jgi:nicotinamide-nucleotide adenylyltransferase
MGEPERLYETGVIHGRFQVLHNDHLKYLLAGKALCHHLVVGITNPDPFLTKNERADPDRSEPLANPLTYYERHVMLKMVLLETGIDWHDFTIVPLPINLPDRYIYYVPMEAVFFLSIYDNWGRSKLRYFQSLGLRTYVLREAPIEKKGLSAGEIRHRMIIGQPWEHLVPPCIAPLMHKWNLPGRLKLLRGS